MKSDQALWLGRFQPPTIAHLATAQTILNEWNRLTIGIVHSSLQSGHGELVDPKWEVFLKRTAETSFASGKNPFTPEEVSRMWIACLREQHFENRVSTKPMPQIAYQPCFNEEFEPLLFNFIEVKLEGDDAEVDRDRQLAFSHLIGRPISYISPPFKLHNSEIRSLVLRGGRRWEEFIPLGAYSVFVEINGPCRMVEAQ